jgi:hypothetical protein
MFVCEGADMNQTINEPDIAKDEPKVGQNIVVASDMAQANISIDTGIYFSMPTSIRIEMN